MSADFAKQYNLRLNFAFGAILVLLFYRFVQGVLVSQLGQPVVPVDANDWVYLIFYNTGLMQYAFAHPFVASVLDMLLFLLPILAMVTGRRMFVVGTTIGLLLYQFIFNWVTYHNYHGLVGALVLTIPFWSKREERFELLWQGARYYWLYVFASAGLWKVLRGSAFHDGQLSAILMEQQLDLLLQHPTGWKAQIVEYLISHKSVANVVLLVNVTLQLSFLAGFFTRRFDRVLIALSFIFCMANYFVMHIISAELLVLNLTLLDWNWVQRKWFGELRPSATA